MLWPKLGRRIKPFSNALLRAHWGKAKEALFQFEALF